MISHKMITKILCWNFEKSFLKWEKMASRKIFQHFLSANFFMFLLLISNHTVFLVQFWVNLHLWVFQKAEITLAEAARAISAFWKGHSCKSIPKWTRNHMITYTNVIWSTVSLCTIEPPVGEHLLTPWVPDHCICCVSWKWVSSEKIQMQ